MILDLCLATRQPAGDGCSYARSNHRIDHVETELEVKTHRPAGHASKRLVRAFG